MSLLDNMYNDEHWDQLLETIIARVDAAHFWGMIERKLSMFKQVPMTRYHQNIITTALHNAKPKTNDRDRMDDWIAMCTTVGEAIRALGGHFDMGRWMDLCYHGPK